MPETNTKRISTGVAGLDTVLDGGFVPGETCIVEGILATGKTTFALQFLHAAAPDERCLYVTLSDSRNELAAIASTRGWSVDQIAIVEAVEFLRNDAATVACCKWDPKVGSTDEAFSRILNAVEGAQVSRVVIDSLAELRILAQGATTYEAQVARIMQLLRSKGCIALVLDDVAVGRCKGHGPADCVLTFEREAAVDGTSGISLRGERRAVAFLEGCHRVSIDTRGVGVIPDTTNRRVVRESADGSDRAAAWWRRSPGRDRPGTARRVAQPYRLFGAWDHTGDIVLADAIECLCQSVRNATAIDIRFDRFRDPLRVDEKAALIAFRTVRKLLRFAANDVMAREVRIAVARVDDLLVVRMALDSISGRNWADGLCNDCSSLASVVTACGGRLHCEAARDAAGNEVVVTIPLSGFPLQPPSVRADSFRYLQA